MNPASKSCCTFSLRYSKDWFQTFLGCVACVGVVGVPDCLVKARSQAGKTNNPPGLIHIELLYRFYSVQKEDLFLAGFFFF